MSIADMILDGLLDEQTGEYIGDVNEGIYGEAAPGFPVSYEGNVCLLCGKKCKPGGLRQHMEAKHRVTDREGSDGD